MRLVQIQVGNSVYVVDISDPRLCKDFTDDCNIVADFKLCARYDPEQGMCPFVGECDH